MRSVQDRDRARCDRFVIERRGKLVAALIPTYVAHALATKPPGAHECPKAAQAPEERDLNAAVAKLRAGARQDWEMGKG